MCLVIQLESRLSMKEKKIVEAHSQEETTDVLEVIPAHIDRKQASQEEFDHAKKFLTKVYGGKRCIVCEARGENPLEHYPENHIESHHVFEWCHWNDNNMQMVEVALRSLSPFIHGLYMISKADVLAGKPIPTLWEHPDLINKPFDSLDDARNQFFLCHAHHQQSTNDQIKAGYDIIGLHHVAWTIWLQYLGMPTGKIPALHAKHHDDGLNRKV
jgi:hypothetical protein